MRYFFQLRYMAVIAAIAALAGALLLFLIGGFHTFEAFKFALGFEVVSGQDGAQTAVVRIIESLDSFLLGFVLLYFAYSTYFLFVAKENSETAREKVEMPKWLKVEDLGHMKRVLLEVILVLLAVFFLKLVILEETSLEWTTLVIPAAIVAIAISLKLVHFD